jgi:hypothetical protein
VVSQVAVHDRRVYAAGWDGRLRAFDDEGKSRWTLDCTAAMNPADPVAALAESAKHEPAKLHAAHRAPTTSETVPAGENLLRKATLKVGGTPGWMSSGVVQVKAEELTNSKQDDVTKPWLPLQELFWDANAGRQVWAEVTFKEPTNVKAVTVYENTKHPESWPTEGVVQVWDDNDKRWKTAAFGVFLKGPVNTYALDLKGVTKLRYLPWNSYFRNFYTSEIEVR